VGLPFLTIS